MTKNLKFLVLSACVAAAGSLKADTAAKPRVIEISGNDAMHFSIAEITAQPGEALEVVMTNVGEVPKQAMAHNWVLLRPMTDEALGAFAMSAMTKAPDYIPDDQSSIIAHTKTLGPKESDKVDFKAPTTKGEYTYICTFPGHYTLMHGKLIVK